MGDTRRVFRANSWRFESGLPRFSVQVPEKWTASHDIERSVISRFHGERNSNLATRMVLELDPMAIVPIVDLRVGPVLIARSTHGAQILNLNHVHSPFRIPLGGLHGLGLTTVEVELGVQNFR